jgi:hypothetical protein
MKLLIKVIFFFILQSSIFSTTAQIKKAPDRKEGDGPWSQLILRGATVVNGTGAPPVGPMDIVIEGNKIVSIKNVGYPGVEIKQSSRPVLKAGGKEPMPMLDEGFMHVRTIEDLDGHIWGIIHLDLEKFTAQKKLQTNSK